MTEQPDKLVTTETPSAPQQPTADQMTPAATMAIVGRLKHVFTLIDDMLKSDFRGRIWAVWGVVGGAAPTVSEFESVDELCKLIADIRAKHNAERDNTYFLHMFCGQRYQIQKGRTWQLFDGRQLTPIEGGEIEPYLDQTGLMDDRPNLDDVVIGRPDDAYDTGPPEEDAEPEDTLAPPAEDAEVEVVPPIVGEEAAPPGEDPEIA